MLKDYEYAEFETVKEDFNEYELEDGALLRAKLVMLKILMQKTSEGYTFVFNHAKVFGIHAPLEISGEPDHNKYPPEVLAESIIENDMKFKIKREEWNEYIIKKNNMKIMAKLIVTTVDKSSKFDEYGDPVYSIGAEAIFKAVPLKKS